MASIHERLERHEINGVTCLDCGSILFSTRDLIYHLVENPRHHYYKFRRGLGVLFIDPLFSMELADIGMADELIDVAKSELREEIRKEIENERKEQE